MCMLKNLTRNHLYVIPNKLSFILTTHYLDAIPLSFVANVMAIAIG